MTNPVPILAPLDLDGPIELIEEILGQSEVKLATFGLMKFVELGATFTAAEISAEELLKVRKLRIDIVEQTKGMKVYGQSEEEISQRISELLNQSDDEVREDIVKSKICVAVERVIASSELLTAMCGFPTRAFHEWAGNDIKPMKSRLAILHANLGESSIHALVCKSIQNLGVVRRYRIKSDLGYYGKAEQSLFKSYIEELDTQLNDIRLDLAL